MKAVRVHEFGDIHDLHLDTVDDPEPKAGELLIRIRAVAVNFVDLLVIGGRYQFLPPRPFSPGKLPVGEVVALGAGVEQFAVGDRVMALAEEGGYAEMLCVTASVCYKLPDELTFVDAASVSLGSDTAWFALHARARLQKGETVLVLGATGAVGHAAIQLAKASGAHVLAAVSSAERAPIALDAGADGIGDLSMGDLRESLRAQVYANNGGAGADIVLDPLGDNIFDAAIRAVGWGGRMVVIGFAAGRIPSVKANYLLVKNIEVSGLQVTDYRKRRPEQMAECMHDIFGRVGQGQLRALPSHVFALSQYQDALTLIRDRKAGKRVVLTP